MAAMIPIGTLTNSTHCHPRASVSTPPSSTPAAPPEPATAPQAPSALLRSAPSANMVTTIESAAGDRIAAPRPCTAHAPAPQEVGGTTAEEQEPAEGQHVGVDHPLQVLLAEVEVALNRRQSDVD